jgi:hypothetical protein
LREPPPNNNFFFLFLKKKKMRWELIPTATGVGLNAAREKLRGAPFSQQAAPVAAALVGTGLVGSVAVNTAQAFHNHNLKKKLAANTATVGVEATPAMELEARPAVQVEATPAMELKATPAVKVEATPAVQVEVEATPADETDDKNVEKQAQLLVELELLKMERDDLKQQTEEYQIENRNLKSQLLESLKTEDEDLPDGSAVSPGRSSVFSKLSPFKKGPKGRTKRIRPFY